MFYYIVAKIHGLPFQVIKSSHSWATPTYHCIRCVRNCVCWRDPYYPRPILRVHCNSFRQKLLHSHLVELIGLVILCVFFPEFQNDHLWRSTFYWNSMGNNIFIIFSRNTQQNTIKLGTFVNFMCVYKCPEDCLRNSPGSSFQSLMPAYLNDCKPYDVVLTCGSSAIFWYLKE
jgi:hypothetical protein